MVKAMRRPAPRMSQKSLPAAVGGWNARDPLAAMDPRDAIVMDNWFPGTAEISVRKGSAEHVTGIGAQVESLMPYNSASASTLFAAAGTAFYNVTSAGAVGAAVVSSLTNARWYHVNMRTAGGVYLYAANGVDAPRLWDGSSWVAVTGASSPAITGPTTTTLVYPFMWKRRLWFVQAASMSAWYLPVDSIGGAASEINFGPLFKEGGYLVAGTAWTLDAGDGVDDYLALITSKGEVAIYQGTDPASASTFALRGVFRIAPPIGRRCFARVGGDVVVITRDGFVTLSQALLSDRVTTKGSISDKIRNAVSTASALYSSTFGWECVPYPDGPALIFNIPVAAGSQQQYVVNTITGAWCRFTGWAANCFGVLSDVLYYGGNGVVYKAWTGYVDVSAAIQGDVMQAYNYFGTPGLQKHFKMARPILVTDGAPAINMAMNVDFEDAQPTAPISVAATTAGVWDSSVWDGAVWGGDPSVKRDWQGIGNIGAAGSLRLRSSTAGIQTRWTATDLIYEVGGVL